MYLELIYNQVKKLNEKSIIICPDEFLVSIVNYFSLQDDILDFKVVSEKEVINILYGKYDPWDNASISEFDIQTQKHLVDMCRLIKNTYPNDNLIINKLKKLKLNLGVSINSPNIFENKEIILFNTELKFIKTLFQNATILEYKMDAKKELELFAFDDIYNEIDYVANEISLLLSTGIRPSEIQIYNVNKEYQNIIDLIFKLYNIPINLTKGRTLSTFKMSEELMDLIKKDKMLEIEEICSKAENVEYIQQVVLILNKYIALKKPLSSYLEYIKDDFKKTKLPNPSTLAGINITNEINATNHIFIIGMHNGNFPSFKKDNGIVQDVDKELLNLNTSLENNKYRVKLLKELINAPNVMHCSYAKMGFEKPTNISSFLMNLENLKVEIKSSIKPIQFSKASVLIDSSIQYYKFNNQDLITDKFTIYKNNNLLNFNKYNQQVKNFDLLPDATSFNLSSSSIERYNLCPYSFYLNKILKVYIKPHYTWHMTVGTYAHYLLECFTKDFHGLVKDNLPSTIARYFDVFHQYKQTFIRDSEEEFNQEELFYLNHIANIFLEVCVYIESQTYYLELVGLEVEFEVELDYNSKLVGFIDKVLVDKAGNHLVIDYKTGYSKLKFDYLSKGLDMQNLIYCNYYLLNNKKIGGTYRQKIKPQFYKQELEFIKNHMLNGFSFTDEFIALKKYARHYNFAFKKNGEYKANKGPVDPSVLDDWNQIVTTQIKSVHEKIIHNQFPITPVKSYDKDACKYCDYNHICFKNEDNYNYIRKDEDEFHK